MSDIQDEWTLLKVVVYEKFHSKLDDGSLIWMEVCRSLRNQGFGNIFLVIDLLRSLPPTSVNDETTFSQMKLTKGKRRGRMKNSTFNDLLLVHLESACIQEFRPDRAIRKWLISVTPSGRRRRVGYRRVVPTQPSGVEVEQNIIADQEEQAVVQGVEPVVQGVEPVVQGVEPVVQGVDPVVQGGMPVVQDEEPVVQGMEPVVQGGMPVVQDEEPVVQGGEPIVQGVDPIVQDREQDLSDYYSDDGYSSQDSESDCEMSEREVESHLFNYLKKQS